MSYEKIDQWAETYGSPLFILDVNKLKADFLAFQEAFQRHWPNTVICYSVKTNYLPWVCRYLFDLGAIPEIICGMEIDIVERLGYLNQTVVVNGPLKKNDELERLIQANCYIHVDNSDELVRIESIAKRLNTNAKIGLRVFTDINGWKRFGIELHSKRYNDAIRFIQQSSSMTLTGLHCHLGTAILNTDVYVQAAQALSLEIKSLIDELKFSSIEYIDLGGGFPTEDARLNHYTEEQWNVPSYDVFAEDIIKALKPCLEAYQLKLLLEPGRAIVDNAMTLMSSVYSVQDEKVVLDAGKNIIPSISARIHPIQVLQNHSVSGSVKKYDIFGPLCMGSDCFGCSVELPVLNVNDYVLISAAGAYSISQSMQFIRYLPAFIAVDEGQDMLIRHKQSYEDVFSLDIID